MHFTNSAGIVCESDYMTRGCMENIFDLPPVDKLYAALMDGVFVVDVPSES